jgi:transposase
MQVKKTGYPASVMVWAAIGKNFRHIVIHEGGEETADKRWSSKAEMVQKLKLNTSRINHSKRYSKLELLALSEKAQSQWLEMEFQWSRGKGGKGVNSTVHCQRCLAPMAQAVWKKKHLVLEDNARIHTSNYSTVFKINNKLTMLEGHPANSCDLNPCEFVWAHLKEKVSFHGPATAKDMEKAITKEFNAIPQEKVEKWVQAYWARLRRCVEKRWERECRVPRNLRE